MSSVFTESKSYKSRKSEKIKIMGSVLDLPAQPIRQKSTHYRPDWLCSLGGNFFRFSKVNNIHLMWKILRPKPSHFFHLFFS